MSRGRLLVVTSVHRPDDPRIRVKLIGTLSSEWDVAFAARSPGPSDTSGLVWVPLEGSRLWRWLRASRLILGREWDLVAIHDPELLPAAWLRALRGRRALFDLHENLPAQLRTREATPGWLRPLLSALARLTLRVTERLLTVTVAEEGYLRLFARPHPVIANYLPAVLPDPRAAEQPPYMAYLGEVTEIRGAFLAVEAAAGAGHSLVMVGRVSPPGIAAALARHAVALGVDLELAGPLPHTEALDRIAGATAGLSPLLDVGNYRHSLPTKVLEYLAIGLPVLASDLPGTRQPVADLAGVLFAPAGDAAEWRKAGKELVADPSLRDRVVSQTETVRASFAWPADEVLAVYRSAAR